MQELETQSPLRLIDARVKVLALGAALIISVTTPARAFPAFAAYFVVLALGLRVGRVPARRAFRRALIIVPFAAMVGVFLPFFPRDAADSVRVGLGDLQVSHSGLLMFWGVVAKSYLGALAVLVLTETTAFAKILEALEALKVPRLAVLLAAFTHRYAFVLADEAARMSRARDARCYGGRWLWQAGVVGRMIGTLFLRSYERGERVYAAMTARGFSRSVAIHAPRRLRWVDYGLLIGFAGGFLMLRLGLAALPLSGS